MNVLVSMLSTVNAVEIVAMFIVMSVSATTLAIVSQLWGRFPIIITLLGLFFDLFHELFHTIYYH